MHIKYKFSIQGESATDGDPVGVEHVVPQIYNLHVNRSSVYFL
jgi:hypothetical protein